jgi:hypothetical protein
MNERKPELIVSEDGKRITVNGPMVGTSHTFELIDFVPRGYLIWNIGKNMAEGYLPLCRLCAIQPFPGGRNIDGDTLKAVKCEGAQIILDAIHSGADTIAKMEKYIVKYQNANEGTWEHTCVKKIEEALPYMRKIKWA